MWEFPDPLASLALPPRGRSRRVSSNEQPNWNDGNFDMTRLAPGEREESSASARMSHHATDGESHFFGALPCTHLMSRVRETFGWWALHRALSLGSDRR